MTTNYARIEVVGALCFVLSCLLGYGAVSWAGWLLTFRRNVGPSSGRVKRSQKSKFLKTNVLIFLETSGNIQ